MALTDQPDDRRRFQRVPIGVIVRVENNGSSRRYYSKDVSAGGVFLLAETPLPEETPVELEMYLPLITSPVHAKGEVVWIRRQNPSGFAIQFNEITEAAQDLIRWVVQRYMGEG